MERLLLFINNYSSSGLMACLVLQFSVLKALNQFLGQWPNDKNNHHHNNNVEVGFILFYVIYQGLPWWFSVKEFFWLCRRLGFNPWARKSPWRRKWQSTPSCLGNPMDWGAWRYSPLGRRRVRHDLVTKRQQHQQCHLSPQQSIKEALL